MAKLTLAFKDRILKIFPVNGQCLRIGREPDCDVHIDSLAVDPHHADVVVAGRDYQIVPAGEAKVTVNNEAVTEARTIDNGDRIQIGKHTLIYSDEGRLPDNQVTPLSRRMVTGWLQIMSGSHFGRTIRLDRAMTRIGKRGQNTAMVARRGDGYYISHLEGAETPRINGADIGETTTLLEEGDRLTIGNLELHFFLDNADNKHAPEAVPEDEHAQRNFTRVAFDSRVSLCAGEHQWDSQVIDLSLKGALIKRPSDWSDAPQESYVMTLELDPETRIRMEVTVAHEEAGQIGLRCQDIDVDSITHLRRLVELNLGDPNLLERELASLG